MIRVPNAQEFAAQPYEERVRLTQALRDLLIAWAETERS